MLKDVFYSYIVDFWKDSFYYCLPEVFLCRRRIQFIVNRWHSLNSLVKAGNLRQWRWSIGAMVSLFRVHWL